MIKTKDIPSIVSAKLTGSEIDATPMIQSPSFSHLNDYLFSLIRGTTKKHTIQLTDKPSTLLAKIAWGSLRGMVHPSNTKPFVLAVASEGRDRLKCFLGSHKTTANASMMTNHFSSAYRGLDAETEIKPSALGAEILNSVNDCHYWTRLISTPPSLRQEDSWSPIDTVASGMGNDPWLLLIEAWPFLRSKTEAIIEQCTKVTTLLQSLKSENKTIGSISTTVTNAHVTRAIDNLEKSLFLLQEAVVEGAWTTRVHLGSSSPEAAHSAASIFAGCIVPDEQSIQPTRLIQCSKSGPAVDPAWLNPISLGEILGEISEPGVILPLSTSRLAYLADLPKREYRGFAVQRYAEFDINLPIKTAGPAINLGQTIRDSISARSTKKPLQPDEILSIKTEDLARHVLVAGVTGSGKSVSMSTILHKLADNKIPFLIVEPAKAEYREHLAKLRDLQCHRLGDGSAFCINPFDVPRGIRVQVHLDHIKSLFNASFVMYSPMPQVLEQCLHEIYVDNGWGLASNTNPRLKDHDKASDQLRQLLFPTLSDLSAKIDQVVDRLGYGPEITMNVKAGLKTRIDSLKLGSKGILLDGQSTISMADILSKPTVLELELISDDEEKCFLMGLLFLATYEHRLAEHSSPARSLDKIKHFFVIEEAHRLLRATEMSSDPEQANGRGKAVEDFCNMLSEMRAYGQGFGVCEQIPAKLAQDIIKNTNLKIVHRMLAADDRESLASCMCMDESQKDALPSLPPGRAVVFSEGMDGPMLIDFIPETPPSLTIKGGHHKKPFKTMAKPEPELKAALLALIAEEMIFPSGKIADNISRQLGEPDKVIKALQEITSIWVRRYIIDAHKELQLLSQIKDAQKYLTSENVSKKIDALVSSLAEDIWSTISEKDQPNEFCKFNCKDNNCLIFPMTLQFRPQIKTALFQIACRANRGAAKDSSELLKNEITRLFPYASRDLKSRIGCCGLIQAAWSSGMPEDMAKALVKVTNRILLGERRQERKT